MSLYDVTRKLEKLSGYYIANIVREEWKFGFGFEF